MRQAVIQKAEERQRRQQPNLTGIPTQMKLDFEQRSGLSFDDVRVHYNSDKPAQIGALAYTQGPQVHIGPGQDRHLRHELGHVVQQKHGIVRPSGKLRGRQVNTNPQLEQQADSILDTTYPLSRLNSHNSYETQDIYQFEFGNYYSPYATNIENSMNLIFRLYRNITAADKTELIKFAMMIEFSLLNGTPPNEIADMVERKVRSIPSNMSDLKSAYSYIEGLLKIPFDLARSAADRSDEGLYTRAYLESFYNSIEVNNGDKPKTKAYLRKLGKTRDQKLSDGGRKFIKIKPHAVKPLEQDRWSLALNDVYIGRLIDLGVYFRIDDISDDLKQKIQRVSEDPKNNDEKVESLLDLFRDGGTENTVFDVRSEYRFSTLAREIAQLMYRGYIFRCFDRREGKKGKYGLGNIKLLAFKDNTALTTYQEEYNRKHIPRTASEGDSRSTSPTLPEVKPVTT